MAKFGDGGDLLKCSFCGKSQKQVKKLIAGPGVYICDECIDLCNEIIEEEFAEHTEVGFGELPKPRDIFQFLNVIRVYTKKPGKPADMSSPYTSPRGSTVSDLAAHIHRDLADSFKTARLWGAGVFDGQSVPRDHVLHDKDVLELHT